MSGMRKLPSEAGMLGMMTRKVMIRPCSVNTRLYVLLPASMVVCSLGTRAWPVMTVWPVAVMAVLVGSQSSTRTARAATPPRKNMNSTAKRYITPIFL
jgi:hypothetical protein